MKRSVWWGSGRGRWLVTTTVLALDALVVTAFVLAFLGRYVSPAVAWRLQLVALGFPVAATAVVVLAVGWAVWGARRSGPSVKAALAIHLVLAAVALFRLVNLDRPDGEAGGLRILSLNAGESSRGEGREAGALFDRTRPDVVALQEAPLRWVPTADGRKALAAPPTAMAALQRGYEGEPSAQPARVTTLVNRPTRSETVAVLGDTLDLSTSVYRRTVLKWDGADIAIYNVHLRSFNAGRPSWPPRWDRLSEWLRAVDRLGMDFVLRAREAERLKAILNQEVFPFIVVGDLNTTPHQWAYAHLSEGLRDIMGVAPGFAHTFPADRPVVQIDAAFASPTWAVAEATVEAEGISDHRPILVDVTLIP